MRNISTFAAALSRHAPAPPGRTALVGHWLKNEQTGRLECHWSLESAEGTGGEGAELTVSRPKALGASTAPAANLRWVAARQPDAAFRSAPSPLPCPPMGREGKRLSSVRGEP